MDTQRASDLSVMSHSSKATMIVRGCRGAHGMGNLYIYKGTIHAEQGAEGFGVTCDAIHHFQGSRCLFPQDNAKPECPKTACVHASSLGAKLAACSLDLSPTENIWHMMK